MRTLFLISIIGLALSACSLFSGKQEKGTRTQSAKTSVQLYQKAKGQISKKSYLAAIETLETLEAQYPFTPEATQGQLDLVFAQYKVGESLDAVNTAKRFLNLNPQHPKADYAYYMIGVAHFDRSKTRLERYLPVDLSKRDLAIVKTAFNDFSSLVQRFPNSKYKQDAMQRMVYLRNVMARAEINVANYYFEREAYLAAANRGRFVVENFPRTPAVADGLAVMVQGYTLMGMQQHADDALKILKKNFPKHPSLDADGSFKLQLTEAKAQRNWINKATLGLFQNPTPPKFDNRSESEQ